ncbi:MAG: class I SAM-dependent methyltransferase [Salinivirgaceae bacterium]|jgi:tRNA (cmo5U34)-methyltransferase|nr:class I SAM-dependent methyltransferase [Salinivirgaceae bacterium]
MSQKHSESVKQNFEDKASEYDEFMLKCIPNYSEMTEYLVNNLPFNTNEELAICDLGSGTGNVTVLLDKTFPNAKINCVDISPMMIDMAKAKLNNESITYEIADFYEYEFSQKYDIITSSLALHHLVTDDDKKMFYKKIYSALNEGGIFYNADVVIAASETTETNIMELWKQWLRRYHSEDDLMEMVINRYYEEDRPTTIANHLNWMQEIGFIEVDVIWRKAKAAVFGGGR